jgi:16S rRNA (guanine966-N2)-methyltransferase
VRVVAGSARGRRLVAPKGDLVRPTTDRVKESVFNALGSLEVLEGAAVLDLFAGSGALGIEALSRGADHVTFVDDHPRSIAALRANLAATGLSDRARVVRADVFTHLAGPRSPSAQPHPLLVFADPPYRFDRWSALLEALEAFNAPDALEAGPPGTDGLLAVLESDREPPVPPTWDLLRSRTYGSTVVSFLQIRRARSSDVIGPGA